MTAEGGAERSGESARGRRLEENEAHRERPVARRTPLAPRRSPAARVQRGRQLHRVAPDGGAVRSRRLLDEALVAQRRQRRDDTLELLDAVLERGRPVSLGGDGNCRTRSIQLRVRHGCSIDTTAPALETFLGRGRRPRRCLGLRIVRRLERLAPADGSLPPAAAPHRPGAADHAPPPADQGHHPADQVTTPPSATTPPTRGPDGAPVVDVPRSINATGRVNVTDRLQQFIDRVPDGRVIRFRRNGRYRAEGTLFVNHRNDLVFDGNGATLFATIGGAPDRSQWWLKDSSTIVFRDLNVRGANPKGGTSEGAYNVEQETQHGFRMEGVDGVEIDNVHVSDVYGDFVYIGRDKDRVASQNVWIHDSDFRRNGRQGIAITAATNVIIERNTIDQTRRSTIDLEPNARSWHVSHVFVLDNTVGKGRLLFVASHGQGPVDNVVISGNRLRGHALTIDAIPPEGKRRSNWIITDNVSDTTVHNRPMRFFAIDGLVVAGNTQKVSGGQPGVIVTDDCGTRITDNDFGRAGVTRHGDPCEAALAVPAVPAILDRNAAHDHDHDAAHRDDPAGDHAGFDGRAADHARAGARHRRRRWRGRQRARCGPRDRVGTTRPRLDRLRVVRAVTDAPGPATRTLIVTGAAPGARSTADSLSS